MPKSDSCYNLRGFKKYCNQCDGCRHLSNCCSSAQAWRIVRDKVFLHFKRMEELELRHEQRLIVESGLGDIPHQLITISLPPTHTPKFIKALHDNGHPIWDYVQGKSIYTYEFWGKELQYHPHIHWIFQGNLPRGAAARVIRDFSSYYGVTTNFVDIGQRSKMRECYESRVSYIKGEKCIGCPELDPTLEQLDKDRETRRDIDLSQFYYL